MNGHSSAATPGLAVEESPETFEVWARRDFVPESLKDRIRSAKILFVPELDRHPDGRPLFPVGTESLFAWFQQAFPPDAVELPVDESDYAEVALHADIKRVGSFLVNSVALALFLNVLGSYIYDKIRPSKRDTIVFSVTVTDGTRSKKFDFSGSAEDFNEASAAIEKVWQEEK